MHTDAGLSPRYIRCREKQGPEQHISYAVLYFLVQVLVLSGRIPEKTVNTALSRRGPGGGVHQSGEARGGWEECGHKQPPHVSGLSNIGLFFSHRIIMGQQGFSAHTSLRD